jgi:hypothetical protein
MGDQGVNYKMLFINLLIGLVVVLMMIAFMYSVTM